MTKRKLFITALIVIAVVAVIAMPFLNGVDPVREPDRVGEERVVVIKLAGTIQEAPGGFFVGGITPDQVYRQLERAAEDPAIEGVVLRIESPGGSIAASQKIASMVRNFEKPIVVSMADMAASGGYYIAAPAQGIVAHPGTLTGSIGVISSIMDMEELYEMLGIKVETIKSGEHKDMFSRSLTDEERQLMQDISDEAYEQFITDVAGGRDMDPEEVRELATGELFLGSQALELGLVDRLGGIEEAIEYLAEMNDLEKPVRYEYPAPSLFAQIFDYGYSVLAVLERSFTDPKIVLLEKLREGVPPDIRYQVR